MNENTILLEDIIIPESFLKTKPKKEKMDRVRKYVEQYNEFDKPVVLHKGILIDGYVRYLVAKELGLKEIPCAKEFDRYITGKHKGNNKEYIWKVPKGFNIEVGDKVIVNIKNGKVIVDVIKVGIIEDTEMLKHKSVIKKLKNKQVHCCGNVDNVMNKPVDNLI